ncbi:hypothetical protein QW131_05730 [Roseibium salinum]|nr:hypothetical protein [Roseibium salinum]
MPPFFGFEALHPGWEQFAQLDLNLHVASVPQARAPRRFMAIVALTAFGFPVHKAGHDDGHTEHHFDHHYLQLATPLAVAVPSWHKFL